MNVLSKSLLRMSAQIYKLEKFKEDSLEELAAKDAEIARLKVENERHTLDLLDAGQEVDRLTDLIKELRHMASTHMDRGEMVEVIEHVMGRYSE